MEISDEATWQRILDRVVNGAPIDVPAAQFFVPSRSLVDPYHRVRYHR